MNRLTTIVAAFLSVLAVGAVSAGLVAAQSDEGTATPVPTTDSVSPPATDDSGDDATTPDDSSDTEPDATTPDDDSESDGRGDHWCDDMDGSAGDGTTDGAATDTMTSA